MRGMMSREGQVRLGRMRGAGGRFVKSTFGTGRFSGLSEKALRIKVGMEAKRAANMAESMRKAEEKLRNNTVYSLKGAAYEVTTRAKALIVRRVNRKGVGASKWGASKPGQPPLTKGIPKKSLKAAIWYAVDKAKEDAVIGPRFSFVADVAQVHEFGGTRRGKRGTMRYPKRPFMSVALAQTLPKIPAKFRSLLSE